MKTVIRFFVFIVAIFIVYSSNAQPPQRSPEEMAKKETERVKQQLALTDSQVVRYEKIALKYAKIREGFRSMPRDSVQGLRLKIKEQQEKKKAEVKPILTQEQFVKYEKWLEERGDRMGGGNRGNGNSQAQ